MTTLLGSLDWRGHGLPVKPMHAVVSCCCTYESTAPGFPEFLGCVTVLETSETMRTATEQQLSEMDAGYEFSMQIPHGTALRFTDSLLMMVMQCTIRLEEQPSQLWYTHAPILI